MLFEAVYKSKPRKGIDFKTFYEKNLILETLMLNLRDYIHDKNLISHVADYMDGRLHLTDFSDTKIVLGKLTALYLKLFDVSEEAETELMSSYYLFSGLCSWCEHKRAIFRIGNSLAESFKHYNSLDPMINYFAEFRPEEAILCEFLHDGIKYMAMLTPTIVPRYKDKIGHIMLIMNCSDLDDPNGLLFTGLDSEKLHETFDLASEFMDNGKSLVAVAIQSLCYVMTDTQKEIEPLEQANGKTRKQLKSEGTQLRLPIKLVSWNWKPPRYLVDNTWTRRGHWRLQVCGKGRSGRKMIWIAQQTCHRRDPSSKQTTQNNTN